MGRTTRFALLTALGICIVALIFTVGFAWYVSGRLLAPPWYEHRSPEQGLAPGRLTDPRTDFGIDFEEVSLPTGGNATLRGWLVPGAGAAESAIITAHGSGGDRRSFLGLLPSLHEAGYAVLLFDFREYGVSDGAGRGGSGGLREHEDLIAAASYLREERGYGRLAAIGSSLGATSAILAAAVSPQIDAVIAQGASTNAYDLLRAQRPLRAFPDWMIHLILVMAGWRIDAPPELAAKLAPGPLGLVEQIAPRPLFLIHGSEDELIPVEQAERLYARAGEPKSLWIVEGGKHRGLRDYAGPEYARRVLGFLGQHFPVGATVSGP